ncbi:MAG: hypothetical protein OEY36_03575 [Gammaproteobacteria bacterium]|nr:hypothetical protein [Gammaproteobacteria bacterium]
MISKSTLQQAAREGLLSAEQIEPLHRFIQQQASGTEPTTAESLKFIRSFGDIFITLGIVFLLMAINMTSLSGLSNLLPVLIFVVLAEWLLRHRRLVLPGMAILIALLFFINKAISFDTEYALESAFLLLSVSSLLFYWRYKLPFALLPLAAGLVALFSVIIGLDLLQQPAILALPGLIIFSIALWFDTQDTARASSLSDNAFWLYLLAAPLIVHALMVTLIISESAINKNILMMLFFAVFFLLALLIDRRIILVSSQLYLIYALTQLLQNQLGSTQEMMMYILIGLALFVIYFGTYWYKTRRLIFGALSATKIAAWLPAFEADDLRH